MTRLDLHTHTRGSDGTGTPEEFVQAIRRAEIDGIVITDHHRTLTTEGLEVAKAVRAAGLVALVGCEYSTREGHCLIYGVDVARLNLGWYPPMQLVIDRVAEAGGVAFPSHPYRGVKETLGDRIYKIRGLTHVEVANGQNAVGNGWATSARPEADKWAVMAAQSLALAPVGGSDAHVPSRIGTCYTRFAADVRTTVDLIAALKSRDHEAQVNQAMVAAQREAVTRPRRTSSLDTGEWDTYDPPYPYGEEDFEEDPWVR